MKTLLSQFCEEFDQAVRPLLVPLQGTATALDRVAGDPGIRSSLSTVRDLQHHVTTLVDKVSAQQAYVLIFGPLKSGKSTLMNAISAAYVSEVTALPAYPCMVYVSHGTRSEFTVTRYNGETQTLQEVTAMHTLMEWAHGELAARMREVESRGESFEPSIHCPQAIRRVDVKVDAPALAQSSAVLVDTPGLYSRMKFGYGRMTREFRDAAACAIFVVKTDNLFLEQVFAEFSDLLELFSRIFLVVNLDSTKQDLRSDGTLVPSLECEDPERILKAFQNLAMTAPLQQAAEEGRLKIYPVDLLRAASLRLKGGEDAGETDAHAGRIDRFIGDLTDFLNSTDYLVTFLRDSLRQADRLLTECRAICDREVVEDVRGRMLALANDLKACDAIDDAIRQLADHPWGESFSSLGRDLTSIARGRAETLRKSTSRQVRQALDAWFQDDLSLHDLLEKNLRPLLEESRRDLARTAREVFEKAVTTETAGVEIPEGLVETLRSVDLHLGAVGKESLSALDHDDPAIRLKLRVSTESIPVYRGFLDWLLFRRQGTIRERLFGPADAPQIPIPRSRKVSRLGDRGKEALQAVLESGLRSYFDDSLAQLTQNTLGRFVAAFTAGVGDMLQKARSANDRGRGRLEERRRSLGQVADAIEGLEVTLDEARARVDELTTRSGQTDPSLLQQPIDEEETVGGEGSDLAMANGDETPASPTETEPSLERAEHLSEAQHPAEAESLAEAEHPVEEARGVPGEEDRAEEEDESEDRAAPA